MPSSNRRRTFRFSLKLKCRVFSPFRTFTGFAGVTENISRTGILVRLTDATANKRLPVVGNSARIVIDLPDNMNFSQKYLDCEATIVRAGPPEGDCLELGLRVRRMQFRDCDSLARFFSTTGGDPAELESAL
jgi:c-di-GMP-binding flagellar brake protein YcgR